MRIVIASDHGGFHLKEQLVAKLRHQSEVTIHSPPQGGEKNLPRQGRAFNPLPCREGVSEWLQSEREVVDLGTHTMDSVDYPDYARQVCTALLAGEAQRGVLICGTGLGMSMAANRYPGIRAALCHDEYTARLSRHHNDANVLVLGGRVIGDAVAAAILEVWLKEPFDGERHQRRIDLFNIHSHTPFSPNT